MREDKLVCPYCKILLEVTVWSSLGRDIRCTQCGKEFKDEEFIFDRDP